MFTCKSGISGGHFVRSSGISWAVLVEGLMRNILWILEMLFKENVYICRTKTETKKKDS